MEQNSKIKKIKSFFTVKRIRNIGLIIVALTAILLTIRIMNHRDLNSVVSELTQNTYGYYYHNLHSKSNEPDELKAIYKFNEDYTCTHHSFGISDPYGMNDYQYEFKVKKNFLGVLFIKQIWKDNFGRYYKSKLDIWFDDNGRIKAIVQDNGDEYIPVSSEEVSKRRQEDINATNNQTNKDSTQTSPYQTPTLSGFTITNVRNEISGWGDQYQNYITGVVTNHNGITYRQVKLKITLYNKSRQIIGTNYTIINSDEFSDGAKSTFAGTCYTDEKADDVKVEVESTKAK